jgi:ABC-2 type transport system permease protein
MTATTMTPGQRAADGVRVTFARVLHSEWVRLRSVRSTWITMLVTAIIVIGIGALSCQGYVSHPRGAIVQRASEGFDATLRSLVGTFLAQLAFGVLGVLVVTAEYSTGMIRATFTAVPRRMTLFAGRLVMFAATALAVLIPMALLAFTIGQSILSRDDAGTTLGAPHVLRAVIGCALYLAAIGLLGMGLGWLIRHTAGAIVALVGVLFVLPLIIVFLPRPWPNRLEKWLPGGAGQSILHTVHDSESLAPWAGFGVLMVYVAIVMVVAALLLRARDV